MSKKDEQVKEKIEELLASMSSEELSYTLGRYCGPYNVLLCEKTYGFVIPRKLVEDLIASKSFEEIFLDEKRSSKS
jgi:hypothetical protein